MTLTTTDRMIILSIGIGSVIGLLLSFILIGEADSKFMGFLIFILFGGLVGFLVYFMVLKTRWLVGKKR